MWFKMAIHPDDPPYSVLGLPRIRVTVMTDLINAVPSQANGFCFCTGSFGARPDNDLVKMIQRFGDHIHFLHLRNTKRDGGGNFYEANHLGGDADMYAIVKEVLLADETQRYFVTHAARSWPPDAGRFKKENLSRLFGNRKIKRFG